MLATRVEAQVKPRPAADIGQIQKRVEPPKRKRGEVGRIERPAPPAPAPAKGGEAVALTGVEISGVTVYKPADLAPFYEDQIGKRLTEGEIRRILEAIEKRYHDDGYILTRAFAPPQAIEFGVFRVSVAEGYVERVAIEGDLQGGSQRIAAYAHEITSERPLTISTLQRALFLMADLPGVSISPRLREIDVRRGSYELVLTVKRRRFAPFASLDNRGTADVGPLELLAGIDINGILGLEESTRVVLFTVPDQPDELKYGEIRQGYAIGDIGTRVEWSYSQSHVSTNDLSGAPVDGDYWRIRVDAVQPLYLRRENAVRAKASFEAVRSRQSAPGNSFDDRLSVLRVGLDYIFTDRLEGSTAALLLASQGLKIFGASGPGATGLSQPYGRSDFTKLTLDVARRQPLLYGVVMQLDFGAQWSADRLLSSELFLLGGQRFGRGYDPAEVSGENGVAGSVELQYVARIGLPGLDTVTTYGFYDYGVVDPDVGSDQALASAGGGIRWSPMHDVYAGIEFAKPLNRDLLSTGDRGGRVFFRLFAQL